MLRVQVLNLTDALGSVRAGMVPVAAHDDLLLACVGAHRVDTVEAGAARLAQAAALIYVCRITRMENQASRQLKKAGDWSEV